MKKKQGISLIVLIVTIIVIIILAAAVILTITKNNPVESAKEATFKEDVRTFQDELAMTISKDYITKQGNRDEKISTTGNPPSLEEMKQYIPSFTKKYVGKFKIVEDELVYIGDDEKEINWSKDVGLQTENYGKIDFNTEEWDKDATKDTYFKWGSDTLGEEGYNTIIGYSENISQEHLQKLRIPSRCTKIEINPTSLDEFENWYSYREMFGLIEVIEIPQTVKVIGEHAFDGWSSVKEIRIPSGVTNIGEHAFAYCSKLTSVTIPNSVISIGYDAFFNCTSLTSVTIPNSVTSIVENAFFGCNSLKNITIPNSVTSIGYAAFAYCSSLTNIIIPNSVTSTGNYAFGRCSNLTNITIQNGVTTIGFMSFSNCSSLTNITIPNSVTNILGSAFGGCSNLTNITFNGNMAQWNNITKDLSWKDLSGIQTITCTDGVITL